MELSDRQMKILGTSRQQGRVTVEGLAGEFDVTSQTIRRDLNELCDRGLLSRVHGGAIAAHSVSNVGYETRRRLSTEGKRLIGLQAARHIPERCSLFINIGTTTEQVARALYGRRGIVVITNNINVVNILSGSPGLELILAGGAVRQSDGGIVGEAAVDFIRQFKVDYAVIGASAIDEDGSILDYDYREVKVAKAILENARRRILVADASKFEISAPVRICDISDLEVFVTDRPPPTRFREVCQSSDVDLDVLDGVDA